MKAHGSALALLIPIIIVSACAKPSFTEETQAQGASIAPLASPLVTFIELGSVNCVPCKAMQPVMEEVRKKYGGRVSVLFHDVWTKEGEPYGKSYRIRAIPTQVFLDKDGKEYYRHEGFLPFDDIVPILSRGGAKP